MSIFNYTEMCVFAAMVEVITGPGAPFPEDVAYITPFDRNFNIVDDPEYYQEKEYFLPSQQW